MSIDTIALLLQTFAFVVLYIFIGFGPGFVAGIIIANTVFGRGKPRLMDKHNENMKTTAQHNAQWDPTHERWQK